LMQLAEVCRENIYKKGEVIVQGEYSPATIFLLLRGRAILEADKDLVLEKTALNLCSSLAGVPYTKSCICLEDCTVLEIAVADLTDLLAGEPEFCLALLKYFASKRLVDSNGLL
jgi:CRP-like cAMP-binding protein